MLKVFEKCLSFKKNLEDPLESQIRSQMWQRSFLRTTRERKYFQHILKLYREGHARRKGGKKRKPSGDKEVLEIVMKL